MACHSHWVKCLPLSLSSSILSTHVVEAWLTEMSSSTLQRHTYTNVHTGRTDSLKLPSDLHTCPSIHKHTYMCAHTCQRSFKIFSLLRVITSYWEKFIWLEKHSQHPWSCPSFLGSSSVIVRSSSRLLCRLENVAWCEEAKNGLWICRWAASDQFAQKEYHFAKRPSGNGWWWNCCPSTGQLSR